MSQLQKCQKVDIQVLQHRQMYPKNQLYRTGFTPDGEQVLICYLYSLGGELIGQV